MSATQTRHPWRATARTLFALGVAVAASWAAVVEAAGVDATAPVVAATVAVATAVTRVMALPVTDDLLRRFAPWLLPEPAGGMVRCYSCAYDFHEPATVDGRCPSCGGDSYVPV